MKIRELTGRQTQALIVAVLLFLMLAGGGAMQLERHTHWGWPAIVAISAMFAVIVLILTADVMFDLPALGVPRWVAEARRWVWVNAALLVYPLLAAASFDLAGKLRGMWWLPATGVRMTFGFGVLMALGFGWEIAVRVLVHCKCPARQRAAAQAALTMTGGVAIEIVLLLLIVVVWKFAPAESGANLLPWFMPVIGASIWFDLRAVLRRRQDLPWAASKS
jgi:hypothetical protein